MNNENWVYLNEEDELHTGKSSLLDCQNCFNFCFNAMYVHVTKMSSFVVFEFNLTHNVQSNMNGSV